MLFHKPFFLLQQHDKKKSEKMVRKYLKNKTITVGENPSSKPWVLFSSSLLSIYTENYTWVGCHRRPFLLNWFQNFPARSMKGRLKKSILVEIMSWNVMDEVVLQSLEGVSAVGPPATRSSCHPGPRAVDLYPWHFSLNKKKTALPTKNHFKLLPIFKEHYQ